VLEPRSWSLRRNVFQDRLPEALAEGDEVVLADVYGADEVPAGERLDPERLVQDLATLGRPARFLPGADAIAAHVAEHAAPGDVVAVMSNGGFGGLHDKLLTGLRARVPR
jgi:UDP-N-acetylmuramate: L-alanyl-gamma-D-glutamyl-meso-diaminopimelate ligase